MTRLLGRKICSNCGTIYGGKIDAALPCPKCGGVLKVRSDDTEEAIRKRFAIFAGETKPLLAKYAEEGRLAEIAADQAPEEVTRQILEAVA